MKVAEMSDQSLIAALVAMSRDEGSSSYYWHHNPQVTPDTAEMEALKLELGQRLAAGQRSENLSAHR